MYKILACAEPDFLGPNILKFRELLNVGIKQSATCVKDGVGATFFWRFPHLLSAASNQKNSYWVRPDDHVVIVGAGDLKPPGLHKDYICSPQYMELAGLCPKGVISVVDSDESVTSRLKSGKIAWYPDEAKAVLDLNPIKFKFHSAILDQIYKQLRGMYLTGDQKIVVNPLQGKNRAVIHGDITKPSTLDELNDSVKYFLKNARLVVATFSLYYTYFQTLMALESIASKDGLSEPQKQEEAIRELSDLKDRSIATIKAIINDVLLPGGALVLDRMTYQLFRSFAMASQGQKGKLSDVLHDEHDIQIKCVQKNSPAWLNKKSGSEDYSYIASKAGATYQTTDLYYLVKK